MGKLIQKLIHGIVPSWLSKVKTFESSHKKRLPFLKHGNVNSFFSRKSSNLSSSSNNNNICEEIRSEAYESCSSSNIGSTVILLPSTTLQEAHESNIDAVDGSTEDCDIMVNRRQHTGDEDEEKQEASGTGSSHSVEEDGPINGVHAKINGSHGGDENHKEAVEITDSAHESMKSNNSDDPSLWRSQSLSSAKGSMDESRSELMEDDSMKKPHQNPTKRKSGCLQEEDEEEEVEDDAFFFGCDGAAGSCSSKRRRGMKEGLKSCDLPECVSAKVGNAKAVVKFSEDPGHAFWESMVEMIVGNGLWDTGNLEFLLHCYLSLNEPALHETINKSFLQVLHDLHSTA